MRRAPRAWYGNSDAAAEIANARTVPFFVADISGFKARNQNGARPIDPRFSGVFFYTPNASLLQPAS
jgi:hypothetical protein